jgi:hypothetical protein
MKFLTYTNRLEINTPIALEEKQHLAFVNGKWNSLFSWISSDSGRRIFKCRERFEDNETAGKYWISLTSK